MSVLTDSKAQRLSRAYGYLPEAIISDIIRMSSGLRNLDNETISGIIDDAMLLCAEQDYSAKHAVNYAAMRHRKVLREASANMPDSLDVLVEEGFDPAGDFHAPDRITATTTRDIVDESMSRAIVEAPELSRIVSVLMSDSSVYDLLSDGRVNIRPHTVARRLGVRNTTARTMIDDTTSNLVDQVNYTLARHASQAGKIKPKVWADATIASAESAREAMAHIPEGRAGKGHPMPKHRTYAGTKATPEDLRSTARQEDWRSKVVSFGETLDGQQSRP